jgi:hypothetical protein
MLLFNFTMSVLILTLLYLPDSPVVILLIITVLFSAIYQ